jgi:hypothetical protein
MSGPPVPNPADKTLWDDDSGVVDTGTLWDVTDPPYWSDVITILKLFFPQYFDPSSPSYVDPVLLQLLLSVSDEARPWCLSLNRQNFAQAMFTAYLITVQEETSSGKPTPSYLGPISSEKEGDVAITYAAVPQSTDSASRRPSSNPWDAWNRLWNICQKGTITTRFGDPCRSPSGTRITDSNELSWTLRLSAAERLKLA